jgi:hypothetical protein
LLADSLRSWLAERGVKAVIPSNPTRKHPHRYDKKAYKGRNLIERMFCRLKDFRRIVIRHDKRADIYMSVYVRDPLGSRAYLVDQLSPDPRRSRLIKDFKSSKEEETINIFVYGFLRDRMTVVFVGRTFSNLSSQLMDEVKIEDTGEPK